MQPRIGSHRSSVRTAAPLDTPISITGVRRVINSRVKVVEEAAVTAEMRVLQMQPCEVYARQHYYFQRITLSLLHEITKARVIVLLERERTRDSHAFTVRSRRGCINERQTKNYFNKSPEHSRADLQLLISSYWSKLFLTSRMFSRYVLFARTSRPVFVFGRLEQN